MITLLGEFIEAVNFLNKPIISSASSVLTVNTNDSIIHKIISKVNAPGDFTSENGSPWLQVNLTTQTVSAYRGSTFIKSFPVATGKPGHRTDVNTKYKSQTMCGADYTMDIRLLRLTYRTLEYLWYTIITWLC